MALGHGENLVEILDSLIERYFGSDDFRGSARFFRMIRNVLSWRMLNEDVRCEKDYFKRHTIGQAELTQASFSSLVALSSRMRF
jgi:hypothetical protein